jgi:hypothetical protein
MAIVALAASCRRLRHPSDNGIRSLPGNDLGRCARGHRRETQLLRKGGDLAVRLRLELLLQQCCMHPRVLERARAIASRVEAAHQPERDPAARRILCRQSAPPLGGGRIIARRFAAPREVLQRGGVPLVQPRALAIQPALERSGITEVKAVEKGTAEEFYGALELPGVEQPLELGGIAGDELLIERQVVTA